MGGAIDVSGEEQHQQGEGEGYTEVHGLSTTSSTGTGHMENLLG